MLGQVSIRHRSSSVSQSVCAEIKSIRHSAGGLGPMSCHATPVVQRDQLLRLGSPATGNADDHPLGVERCEQQDGWCHTQSGNADGGGFEVEGEIAACV